jgi:uncharacterized membrane protein
MRHLSSLLLRYFFQGLLVVGPLGITVYVLYTIVTWLDSLVQLEDYPGLGIVLVPACCRLLLLYGIGAVICYSITTSLYTDDTPPVL